MEPLPQVSPLPHLPVPLHLALVSCVTLGAASVLTSRLHEPASAHDAVAVGCGLAVLALTIYTRYGLGFPWLSAAVVYLALFWAFHFGLIFTAVLAPTVLSTFADWEMDWLFWPNVRMTTVLAVLGATGFICGLTVTTRRDLPPHCADPVHDHALYTVGWVVMLLGLAGATVQLIASGGIAVLSMSYGAFRDGVLNLGFQLYVDLSQLGCIMTLCGAGRRRWAAPLLAWAPMGVLMMLIGMRAELMIPAVAYAVVLAHRGIHFRRAVLAGALVVAFIAIPTIRIIRDVGFANRAEVDWTEASPLQTLTELGGTLRAAKAYVDWIEDGEEFLLGATYWAPFDRQVLTRLLPDRAPVPFEEDERLPERHMEREGAVGLAALGEAYYNFGAAGPFVYFMFVGLLFGWLESRASLNGYYCALLGIAMMLFYFNIRNHWLAVPGQAAIALTPLAIAAIARRLRPFSG